MPPLRRTAAAPLHTEHCLLLPVSRGSSPFKDPGGQLSGQVWPTDVPVVLSGLPRGNAEEPHGALVLVASPGTQRFGWAQVGAGRWSHVNGRAEH